MSLMLALAPAERNSPRSIECETNERSPAGNPPAPAPAVRAKPASKRSGSRPRRNGQEILVAVRSAVVGADLENVCLIVEGSPHAPSGTAAIRPGNTSSMIELPPEVSGKKIAVYFELSMGSQHIALVTDAIFDFTPGAICLLTIGDHTRAHSPSIEVEGAVAHLVRARPAAKAR
jgi:hypothetical protein